MLSFHQHHWLLRHGASRINAWLDSRTKTAADVSWDILLSYCAGGAQWRRVREWKRPSADLYLHNFRPDIRSWRDLERVDFWQVDPATTSECDPWPGGDLLVEYHNPPFEPPPKRNVNFDIVWRVAARDGALFTVELAADERDLSTLLDVPSLVLPDGAPGDEAAAEFWKDKAALYLIEQIPFGLVTVQVSRNARDPVQQALGRARSLLGLGEPEQIAVNDFAGKPKSETISGDLYVDLHYHSYYEN
ncbi:MAG TPA: hypothetical protein VGG02_14175 [Chthoniobacterales bacterium]|jgi:hypothetical protein